MTSIYCRPIIGDEKGAAAAAKPTEHQVIGESWGRLVQAIPSQSDCDAATYESLGIAKTDRAAQETLKEMVKALFSPTKENPYRFDPAITLSSHPECPGSVILSKDGKNIAIYKAGEARAHKELLAREIAHLLGLEKHAISGSYVVMKNADFFALAKGAHDEEGIYLDLFNGGLKLLSKNKVDGDQFMTGILEPWMKQEKKEEIDLAKLVTLLAALGSNDMKEDGIIGSTSIDNEWYMPRYHVPPKKDWQTTPSALHLPLLDDEKYYHPLSINTIAQLFKTVQSWKPLSILMQLADKKALYFDRVAESKEPQDEGFDEISSSDDGSVYGSTSQSDGSDAASSVNESDDETQSASDSEGSDKASDLGESDDSDDSSFLDAGNYSCKVVTGEDHTAKFPTTLLSDHPDANVLNQEQLEALNKRLVLLHDYIRQKIEAREQFRPIDLILAVDPHYKTVFEQLEMAKSPSPLAKTPPITLTPEAARFSPPFLLGRLTPNKMFQGAVSRSLDAILPSPPPISGARASDPSGAAAGAGSSYK